MYKKFYTSSNVVYSTVDSAVITLWGDLLTQANSLLNPCSSCGSKSTMQKSNLQSNQWNEDGIKSCYGSQKEDY